ncbi:hypothetical protein [Deinococcus peraridilitoris]|uniref:Uncharacterized protein n=1 Tax=Deinococcus peraridilitoris (strain DSM 19664 / LMG 22246 / CIP 109416 / KR-200) TaxID=937777 RepID=K9ZZ60_DEIPD|nr:hypothetical protein [Deinococcus peraridilitoris]AFZ66040.1 hypothetical protein Deipe_0443 [Deinococcus peraridilitoris DSM 19664]
MNTRTFRVGNMDNYFSPENHMPAIIAEAETHEYAVYGPLDKLCAQMVAEDFAAKNFDRFEYPNSFDLLIWEDGTPDVAYRVYVEVRSEPVFDGSARRIDTPLNK